MKILHIEDVLELLRRDIARVGTQTEWARQMGIDRPAISKVLSGRLLPPGSLCQALKLKWVIARRVPTGDEATNLVIISQQNILKILREEIEKVGGVSSWSKLVGVDRSRVSQVLHNKRKSLGPKLLSALGLSEVLVHANGPKTATRSGGRKARAPGKRGRYARW
jgi:hypothetical protein